MDRITKHFNINEIIYSDESVLPGFWKGVLSGFQVVADVRICPYGQLRRLALTSMRLIPAETEDCCASNRLGKSCSGDPWPVYLNVVEIK
jgi:hypothetical protein